MSSAIFKLLSSSRQQASSRGYSECQYYKYRAYVIERSGKQSNCNKGGYGKYKEPISRIDRRVVSHSNMTFLTDLSVTYLKRQIWHSWLTYRLLTLKGITALNCCSVTAKTMNRCEGIDWSNLINGDKRFSCTLRLRKTWRPVGLRERLPCWLSLGCMWLNWSLVGQTCLQLVQAYA